MWFEGFADIVGERDEAVKEVKRVNVKLRETAQDRDDYRDALSILKDDYGVLERQYDAMDRRASDLEEVLGATRVALEVVRKTRDGWEQLANESQKDIAALVERLDQVEQGNNVLNELLAESTSLLVFAMGR